MMFLNDSDEVRRATEDMYAHANATGATFNNVHMSTSTTTRPMSASSSSPRAASNNIRVSPAPTKTSDLPDDSDFVYPGQVISSNNDDQKQNNLSSSPLSAQTFKPSAIATQVRPTTTDSNKKPVSEAELVEKFELDDQTMAQFKEAFRMFDRNDDGRITAQELGIVMKSLNHVPTEPELIDMVSEVDEDGNGTIEFDEFVQMMARRMRARNGDDDDLYDAFHVFDRDKDGYITAQEIRMVMASLGESLTDEELNGMISAADTDGDGRVNYEEFQIMWRNSGN